MLKGKRWIELYDDQDSVGVVDRNTGNTVALITIDSQGRHVFDIPEGSTSYPQINAAPGQERLTRVVTPVRKVEEPKEQPDAISEFLDAFEQYWRKHPHQRFGQLIVNLFNDVNKDNPKTRSLSTLFYQENQPFLNKFSEEGIGAGYQVWIVEQGDVKAGFPFGRKAFLYTSSDKVAKEAAKYQVVQLNAIRAYVTNKDHQVIYQYPEL